MFVWIDYPNARSRAKFNLAKRRGQIPSGARIGGEIGIHGVLNHADHLVDDGVNWTSGCISMKTRDIREICGVAQVGTIVRVAP